MQSIARLVVLSALLTIAPGCGEKPPPTQAKGGDKPIDGNAMVAEVEAKLLASSALRIVIQSDATGAVDAHLKTTLTLAPTDKVRLESEGTFMKEQLRLVLASDGLVMRRKRNDEEVSEAVASTGLRRQMLVELVRMGALHDIALVAEGKFPDHLTDAETWVIAHDATVGDVDPTFEPPARPTNFLVRVSGKETGDCTLHVDKALRPVQRMQIVHFPEGDMRVKESYEFEAVPPDVDYFKP
jgi:hypothetical protein